MTVEILFPEICSLFGDGQNVEYLKLALPEAEFIETPLTDTPYFAENEPDLIYIGSMTEKNQRKVIEKLMPLKARLEALADKGTPILATGSACDIFAKHIDYVTEKIETEALGLFDLTVKTDLFKRYNGKVLGECNGLDIVGFRSQFSFLYGDNSQNAFMTCKRGIGINPESRLEGMRKNNLICTQLVGPILPLNPLFCEYFIGLSGEKAQAPFREAAVSAYEQRLKEFKDPKTEME